jgi:hypothetical protein
MYGDLSHSTLTDLRKREKTVFVYGSTHLVTGDSGRNEVEMDNCVQLYRELFAEDMSLRCGLEEPDGTMANKYPTIIGMACLLNPLYGGKANMFFSLVIIFVNSTLF